MKPTSKDPGALLASRRGVVGGIAASALATIPWQAVAQRVALKKISTDYTPKDDAFGKPFIDVDEMRLHPRPHRYVHGGFAGTETLFSFYFPEAKLYSGRFAQWMEGGAGGNERSLTVSPDNPQPTQWDYLYDMAFDDLNGYLIESNQGHGLFNNKPDTVPGMSTWRASTESARFSRYVAGQIYGTEPKYGYIGGIGGGGGRAVFCMEKAPDVYHGCTPQIIGNAISSYGAMQRAYKFIGKEKLKDVVDAMQPGGSGNPYTTLNAIQREALADLYRTGFPRATENQLKPTRTIGFLYSGLERADPSYFEDFWKLPGYAGADKFDQLKPYIIQRKAKVTSVVPISKAMEPATLQWYAVLPPDLPFAVTLDIPGTEEFYGCEMTVLSGAAKGRNLFINGTFNGLSGFPERTPEMMRGIKPGDEVMLDNRRFLALLHHFLHSVEASPAEQKITGSKVTRAGRPFAPDGVPLYPQRPPMPSMGAIEPKLDSKMIYVASTQDIYVWPITAGYPETYRARYGDKLDERFRVYWAEHGAIGPPQMAVGYNVGEGDLRVWDTRLINFQHSMGRVVWRYLRDWVEEGKAPPASTGYHFNQENALILHDGASKRAGIQPLVHATANGSARANVRVGEAVKLEGTIEAPPGAGTVVQAEWDFGDGEWNFPTKHKEANGSATRLNVATTHSYSKPGTYFVCLRGGIKRDGIGKSAEPSPNIGRVRVVVT